MARDPASTTDIREVIEISKDPKMIKAVLLGIDSRSGENFPSPPVTFQGNAINNTISRQRSLVSGDAEYGWQFDHRNFFARRYEVGPHAGARDRRDNVGDSCRVAKGKNDGSGRESIVRSCEYQTQSTQCTWFAIRNGHGGDAIRRAICL